MFTPYPLRDPLDIIAQKKKVYFSKTYILMQVKNYCSILKIMHPVINSDWHFFHYQRQNFLSKLNDASSQTVTVKCQIKYNNLKYYYNILYLGIQLIKKL